MAPVGAARVDRHRARLVHHQLALRLAHDGDVAAANGGLVAMCPGVVVVVDVVDVMASVLLFKCDFSTALVIAACHEPRSRNS